MGMVSWEHCVGLVWWKDLCVQKENRSPLLFYTHRLLVSIELMGKELAIPIVGVSVGRICSDLDAQMQRRHTKQLRRAAGKNLGTPINQG
jgi:hypothetical protein